MDVVVCACVNCKQCLQVMLLSVHVSCLMLAPPLAPPPLQCQREPCHQEEGGGGAGLAEGLSPPLAPQGPAYRSGTTLQEQGERLGGGAGTGGGAWGGAGGETYSLGGGTGGA